MSKRRNVETSKRRNVKKRALDASPFPRFRVSAFLSVTLLAAGLRAGCRDNEPPRSHYQDLGTEASPLPPTSPPWHNLAISEGKAEWHPFRELDADQEADESASADRDPARQSELIEAEIREMIDEYNDVVAEATVDEWLDYFVEEQHDTLKHLFEGARSAAELYTAIRKELEAKLPDAADRIDAAMGTLGADAALRLNVEAISMVSATEATGAVPRAWVARTCRFRLVDEDWYIEVPKLGGATELKPAMDAGLTMYRGWVEGLRSGQIPPETVLQQLEAASQVVRELLGVDKGTGVNVGTGATGE